MDKTFEQTTYFDSNTTNYISEEYLHINSCGVSRYSFAGKNLAVRYFRPLGRVDYHFLLITRGKTQAVINGQVYELSVGDCVFYTAGDPQDYTYFISDGQPLNESMFIHFSGTATAEILKQAGFSHSCVLSGRSTEAKRIFTSLITSVNSKEQLTACGQLLRLLPLLSPAFSENQSQGMRRIKKEVEYINAHFIEEIDIDICAERCNLSRSRFSHLFSEVMGAPPHKYQLKLRLDMAKDLLESSSLSISEISASVGFADPLYFSRIFKKFFGESPQKYKTMML